MRHGWRHHRLGLGWPGDPLALGIDQRRRTRRHRCEVAAQAGIETLAVTTGNGNQRRRIAAGAVDQGAEGDIEKHAVVAPRQIFTTQTEEFEGGLVGADQITVGADGQQRFAQTTHVVGTGMKTQQALVGEFGFEETLFDDTG